MRGKVLHFDTATGNGIISGDDGQRYEFTRADLAPGLTYLAGGVVVDFEVTDGRAARIYVVPTTFSEKNKWVAAILAFFFGCLGVHKFYLGRTQAGIIMLVCGTVGWLLILPGLAIALISFIELIIYLIKSDQDFHNDYVAGTKSWF